jgi:hypothetical protein
MKQYISAHSIGTIVQARDIEQNILEIIADKKLI